MLHLQCWQAISQICDSWLQNDATLLCSLEENLSTSRPLRDDRSGFLFSDIPLALAAEPLLGSGRGQSDTVPLRSLPRRHIFGSPHPAGGGGVASYPLSDPTIRDMPE